MTNDVAPPAGNMEASSGKTIAVQTTCQCRPSETYV